MAETAYVGNDNVLEVDGLKNAVTGIFLDSLSPGAVTVTLVDEAGVEVAGQTWPTNLNYVAASSGKYRATLSDDVALVDKTLYFARITGDGGPGLKGYWQLPVNAKARRS